MDYAPCRIVCLTEETTEWLYLLGEEQRIILAWGAQHA
jgi:iron complex transport system substrate-binding protein